MQFHSGICELNRLLLVPLTAIKLTQKTGFHHTKVTLAKIHAIAEEKLLENRDIIDASQDVKQGKKALRISCKRTQFNQHVGQTYGKFDDIPLASKGWNHRKSKGDSFIIHGYKDNPAIASSSEPSKNFSEIGVDDRLVTILDKQNITNPTVIQVKGIPAILKGYNTLLNAETGSGKTLTYLLPMIQQIISWQMMFKNRKMNNPLGLVVSPNRELVNQIGEVAMQFTRELMINTEVLTGGHTKRMIMNPEYNDVDLLVASLGSLSKLTTTGIYSMRHVYHVVLDEADTLLDDSFNEKLTHFLKRFPFQFQGESSLSAVPYGVQLTLVSATIPRSLNDILGQVIEPTSLKQVATNHVHRLMPHVPQTFYRLGNSEKPGQLLATVKRNVAKKHPTMIFSNKSSTCDWISMFLNENNVPCVNLNGKMLLDIRTGKLDAFQSGKVDVISCTDIGSRGINTTRVKHVINYDFPLYTADYIHRCGRTGRVGSTEGSCVSNFISTSREVEIVQKIEAAARRSEALPNVNANITRTIKQKIMKNMEKGSLK